MAALLHPNNVDRIPLTGYLIRRLLEARSRAMVKLTDGVPDPDLSIVIRTRNDGAYIEQLFADIKAQLFDGSIEIILVDTGSTDNTVAYAKAHGAKVISLAQKDFTYPRALNLGFRATHNPYVLTLVGHSNLASRMTLKSLTFWSRRQRFGGIYSFPMANANGSIWDRISNIWYPFILWRPLVLRRYSGSMMAANCSIVKREAWEKLGGYDERYAGGGEDVALARSMLAAGYTIVREPLMTLFHSHGLNAINSLRQSWHWIIVGGRKPQKFDTAKIHARRPDLR